MLWEIWALCSIIVKVQHSSDLCHLSKCQNQWITYLPTLVEKGSFQCNQVLMRLCTPRDPPCSPRALSWTVKVESLPPIHVRKQIVRFRPLVRQELQLKVHVALRRVPYLRTHWTNWLLSLHWCWGINFKILQTQSPSLLWASQIWTKLRLRKAGTPCCWDVSILILGEAEHTHSSNFNLQNWTIVTQQ